MKKVLLLAIFTFAFFSISITEASQEMSLDDLRGQKTRIEQMRTIISSFFVLAEKSDQKEIIERALREVSSKMDSIKERIKNRIKEREEEKRKKELEEMIRSLKEKLGIVNEEQKSKEISKEWLQKVIQEIRDREQEIREKEQPKEGLKIETKQCGWCGCDCVEIYPEQICPLVKCINYKYNCVYDKGECVLREIDNGGLPDVNIEIVPPHSKPVEPVQEEKITIEYDFYL